MMKKLLLMLALASGAILLNACQKDDPIKDPAQTLIDYLGKPCAELESDCIQAGYKKETINEETAPLFQYIKGGKVIMFADQNANTTGNIHHIGLSRPAPNNLEQVADRLTASDKAVSDKCEPIIRKLYRIVIGILPNSKEYETIEELCEALQAEKLDDYLINAASVYLGSYKGTEVGVKHSFFYDETTRKAEFREEYQDLLESNQ